MGQDFCALLCCDDAAGACGAGFGLVRVCACAAAVIAAAKAVAVEKTVKARG